MRMVSKTISGVTLVVCALLILRFLLKIAGAHTSASFVVWLYTLTSNIMQPFHGIFPTPSLGGLSVIDLPALTALAIYLVVGYGLATFATSLERNLRIGLTDLKKHFDEPKEPQTPQIPPR
jgi:uncharacterized protein YggT (Ycf19 family)